MTNTNTRTLAKEAALKLLQSGQRPTADRVRAAIGQGAQQTILGALDEFWGEIGERLRDPRLPEPLVEPVMALWSHAVSQADERWQTERIGLEYRIAELVGQVDSSMQQLSREIEARTAAETHVAATEGRNEALQRALDEHRSAYAALNGEADRLRAEVARVKELLQIERDTRERDQAAWLKELDAARQSVKATRAEKEQIGKLLEEFREQNVRQKLLLQQGDLRLQELDRALATRTQERDEASARSDVLERQCELLAGELERVRATGEEQVELIRLADQQHGELTERMTAIQLEKEGVMAENRVLREALALQRADRAEFEASLQRALDRIRDPEQ